MCVSLGSEESHLLPACVLAAAESAVSDLNKAEEAHQRLQMEIRSVYKHPTKTLITVCVCVFEVFELTSLHVCVCLCETLELRVCVSICVCTVCVCEFAYFLHYVCMCVCVDVHVCIVCVLWL